MKYIKKNLFNFILIAFMLVLPVFSLAQGGTEVNTGGGGTEIDTGENVVKITNPIASTTLVGFIEKILRGAIKIGMPVLVLAIIYSGFLFVSAQGNSEKLNEAKRALLYTLIGAAILLGSWGIAQLITETVTAL